MPLTPEDVQNKRFTTVRFKFGYDEEEVDNFLDEIEEELRRLLNENKSLRQAASRTTTAPDPTAVLPPVAQPAPPPTPVAPPPPAALPVPPPMPPAPDLSGLAETDDTALRTLMLAQRTAEDAIAKAHADADEILENARAKATALEQELRSVHTSRLAALEKERSGLVEEIAALRGFEREFRSRLRTYLQSTISDLDKRPSVEPAPAQPAAEAQSVGRHSSPLPTAARPPAPASPAPTPATSQPAPTPPATPPASAPPPAGAPPRPAGPPQQPPAAPPQVPPVAPPASPPPQPPNPFGQAPPPTGPPTQA